jgi:hypothetical protein
MSHVKTNEAKLYNKEQDVLVNKNVLQFPDRYAVCS